MVKYEWEISTLMSVIRNMENETTDTEFLIDTLSDVINTLEEQEG